MFWGHLHSFRCRQAVEITAVPGWLAVGRGSFNMTPAAATTGAPKLSPHTYSQTMQGCTICASFDYYMLNFCCFSLFPQPSLALFPQPSLLFFPQPSLLPFPFFLLYCVLLSFFFFEFTWSDSSSDSPRLLSFTAFSFLGFLHSLFSLLFLPFLPRFLVCHCS